MDKHQAQNFGLEFPGLPQAALQIHKRCSKVLNNLNLWSSIREQVVQKKDRYALIQSQSLERRGRDTGFESAQRSFWSLQQLNNGRLLMSQGP